jgi:hypothetical protein
MKPQTESKNIVAVRFPHSGVYHGVNLPVDGGVSPSDGEPKFH